MAASKRYNKRTLLVLVGMTLILVATLTQTANGRRSRRDRDPEPESLDSFDEDEFDYEQEAQPSRGQESMEQPEIPTGREEAERRQSMLERNTVQSPALSEQIANVATFLPMSERFRLKQRILRLGAFCDLSAQELQRKGVKAPLDKVALALMFIVGSYIPALLLSIFYTVLCKKPEAPRFDPAMHVFNKPDALEMTKVLQTVTKIQESVTKLQQNGLGGSKDGKNNGETQQVLLQTQGQLQQLAQSLQAMEARQDEQNRKLEEMDRRINKNFSIMYDSICKKLDDARLGQPPLPQQIAANQKQQKQTQQPERAQPRQEETVSAPAQPAQQQVQQISAKPQAEAGATPQQQKTVQTASGAPEEEPEEEEYEYYEEDDEVDV